jgi:hypothetical protein
MRRRGFWLMASIQSREASLVRVCVPQRGHSAYRRKIAEKERRQRYTRCPQWSQRRMASKNSLCSALRLFLELCCPHELQIGIYRAGVPTTVISLHM